MSKFKVWPLVKTDDNGSFNLPDSILASVWNQIVAEGKLPYLFYNGLIVCLDDFVQFMKQPQNNVIVVEDVEEKTLCHVAWLNGVEDGHAWVHHCSLGRYKMGASASVLQFWKDIKREDGSQVLHTLLGLTPDSNERAVRFLQAGGFEMVGKAIPNICNMAYEGRRAGGIISYLDLTKEAKHGRRRR